MALAPRTAGACAILLAMRSLQHVRPPGRDLLAATPAGGSPALLMLGDVGASLGRQRLVGLATWAVLLLLLRGETRRVRAQTLAVVAVATMVEYTASPGLGVYTYRLHN